MRTFAPRKTKAAGLALAVMAGAAPALAETAVPPGATACSGCHAVRAIPGSAMPPIHGRPADEIVAAMLAYRADERPATVMNRIAKGFSADEIRAISAWLSAQP
jgi:cytochrome subunit of sulfide dehydrogenase